MAQPRRSKRTDGNQTAIVKKLRAAGYSVELDHDDILVGANGKNFWFELKNPDTEMDKNSRLKKGALKKSQIDLLRSWQGHYEVVFSFEEIMEAIRKVEFKKEVTLK